MSPQVARFEAALAHMAQVPWGVSTVSGTLALELALEAGGVGAGDEVLVPALAAFGTLAAVARTGALPVVVDVSPGTLTLAPDQVDVAITERTRAVIPVHAMGLAPDIAGLRDAAPDLLILEDMAQGFPGPVEGDVAAL
ncbi:MAG: DegT/DnrJ/EryC1/StrS family aminotransferase, partial [Myxococcota bacterium]|nr:DegT/DnrJ/EryC1/StrS family aminotransferase [Myxococcota bacterium]